MVDSGLRGMKYTSPAIGQQGCWELQPWRGWVRAEGSTEKSQKRGYSPPYHPAKSVPVLKHEQMYKASRKSNNSVLDHVLTFMLHCHCLQKWACLPGVSVLWSPTCGLFLLPFCVFIVLLMDQYHRRVKSICPGSIRWGTVTFQGWGKTRQCEWTLQVRVGLRLMVYRGGNCSPGLPVEQCWIPGPTESPKWPCSSCHCHSSYLTWDWVNLRHGIINAWNTFLLKFLWIILL